MVGHTANDQGLHLILARDAAEVEPEPLMKLRLDERAAFFGGPDAMHQTTGEGVHDVPFFRPCGTDIGWRR